MANPWRHTELEVIQALKVLGSGSSYRVGAHLGLSHKWVEDKLRVLYEAGRVYIADWERKSLTGPPRVVYALRLGDEEDLPKPKPLSGSQRSMNYLKRKRLGNLLGVKNERTEECTGDLSC